MTSMTNQEAGAALSILEIADDAFLSGYCAALHVGHVTELNEDDYHAAHIASQGYLDALLAKLEGDV